MPKSLGQAPFRSTQSRRDFISRSSDRASETLSRSLIIRVDRNPSNVINDVSGRINNENLRSTVRPGTLVAPRLDSIEPFSKKQASIPVSLFNNGGSVGVVLSTDSILGGSKGDIWSCDMEHVFNSVKFKDALMNKDKKTLSDMLEEGYEALQKTGGRESGRQAVNFLRRREYIADKVIEMEDRRLGSVVDQSSKYVIRDLMIEHQVTGVAPGSGDYDWKQIKSLLFEKSKNNPALNGKLQELGGVFEKLDKKNQDEINQYFTKAFQFKPNNGKYLGKSSFKNSEIMCSMQKKFVVGTYVGSLSDLTEINFLTHAIPYSKEICNAVSNRKSLPAYSYDVRTGPMAHTMEELTMRLSFAEAKKESDEALEDVIKSHLKKSSSSKSGKNVIQVAAGFISFSQLQALFPDIIDDEARLKDIFYTSYFSGNDGLAVDIFNRFNVTIQEAILNDPDLALIIFSTPKRSEEIFNCLERVASTHPGYWKALANAAKLKSDLMFDDHSSSEKARKLNNCLVMVNEELLKAIEDADKKRISYHLKQGVFDLYLDKRLQTKSNQELEKIVLTIKEHGLLPFFLEELMKHNLGLLSDRLMLFAIATGDHLLGKMLIEKGVELNPDREDTPLVMAIQSGDLKCVRLLLDHGAQIDHKVNHSVTPLYLALIELGATNNTPVRKKVFLEVVKCLLIRGANLNIGGSSKENVPFRCLSLDPIGARVLLDHHVAQGVDDLVEDLDEPNEVTIKLLEASHYGDAQYLAGASLPELAHFHANYERDLMSLVEDYQQGKDIQTHLEKPRADFLRFAAMRLLHTNQLSTPRTKNQLVVPDKTRLDLIRVLDPSVLEAADYLPFDQVSRMLMSSEEYDLLTDLLENHVQNEIKFFDDAYKSKKSNQLPDLYSSLIASVSACRITGEHRPDNMTDEHLEKIKQRQDALIHNIVDAYELVTHSVPV